MDRSQVFRRPGAFVARALLFAGGWLVIAGADPAGWIIGVPAVIAAAWAQGRLSEGTGAGLSPWAAARFLPYFLFESLRGGIDVAARVMRPRMRIAPGLSEYRTSLRHPAARVLFTNSISLLPGTLSADARGALIRVHSLDASQDTNADLQRLERRIAALFRETTPPASATADGLTAPGEA